MRLAYLLTQLFIKINLIFLVGRNKSLPPKGYLVKKYALFKHISSPKAAFAVLFLALLYSEESFNIPCENHLALFVGEGNLIEAFKLALCIPHGEIRGEEEFICSVKVDKLPCTLRAYKGKLRAGIIIHVIKSLVYLGLVPTAITAEVGGDKVHAGVFLCHFCKTVGL